MLWSQQRKSINRHCSVVPQRAMYSSYGSVRSLPLDYLKIDGTYIRNLLTDKTDQALTASMVDVSHALGLKVIAAYGDSEAVYTWLKDIGVDYVRAIGFISPNGLTALF